MKQNIKAGLRMYSKGLITFDVLMLEIGTKNRPILPRGLTERREASSRR
jgi:hypothetical protein